jgi:hypothetical protein
MAGDTVRAGQWAVETQILGMDSPEPNWHSQVAQNAPGIGSTPADRAQYANDTVGSVVEPIRIGGDLIRYGQWVGNVYLLGTEMYEPDFRSTVATHYPKANATSSERDAYENGVWRGFAVSATAAVVVSVIPTPKPTAAASLEVPVRGAPLPDSMLAIPVELPQTSLPYTFTRPGVSGNPVPGVLGIAESTPTGLASSPHVTFPTPRTPWLSTLNPDHLVVFGNSLGHGSLQQIAGPPPLPATPKTLGNYIWNDGGEWFYIPLGSIAAGSESGLSIVTVRPASTVGGLNQFNYHHVEIQAATLSSINNVPSAFVVINKNVCNTCIGTAPLILGPGQSLFVFPETGGRPVLFPPYSTSPLFCEK